MKFICAQHNNKWKCLLHSRHGHRPPFHALDDSSANDVLLLRNGKCSRLEYYSFVRDVVVKTNGETEFIWMNCRWWHCNGILGYTRVALRLIVVGAANDDVIVTHQHFLARRKLLCTRRFHSILFRFRLLFFFYYSLFNETNSPFGIGQLDVLSVRFHFVRFFENNIFMSSMVLVTRNEERRANGEREILSQHMNIWAIHCSLWTKKNIVMLFGLSLDRFCTGNWK